MLTCVWRDEQLFKRCDQQRRGRLTWKALGFAILTLTAKHFSDEALVRLRVANNPELSPDQHQGFVSKTEFETLAIEALYSTFSDQHCSLLHCFFLCFLPPGCVSPHHSTVQLLSVSQPTTPAPPDISMCR